MLNRLSESYRPSKLHQPGEQWVGVHLLLSLSLLWGCFITWDSSGTVSPDHLLLEKKYVWYSRSSWLSRVKLGFVKWIWGYNLFLYHNTDIVWLVFGGWGLRDNWKRRRRSSDHKLWLIYFSWEISKIYVQRQEEQMRQLPASVYSVVSQAQKVGFEGYVLE